MKQKHRVIINIANFVVCLTTDDEDVAQRIRSRYHEFLGSTETPLITIDLKITPGAIFIEPKPGQWIIEASYQGDHLEYKSYLEQGEVDLIEGRGYLEMAPQANVENLLRAVYAWLCIRNGALLLHSAGIIRNGEGYVFFGPSGAGKTTSSRLAARTAHVVSDDLVIIRYDESGGTLYGVPFKGEISDAPRANQKAPLKGIFRLRQDTVHYIEPLSPVKAVADLVAASPFIVAERNLGDQLVNVCQQVAKTVPVLELHFKRDDGFWRIIDEYYENVPSPAPSDGR